MAAAYAVMELIEPGETPVRFDTLSGRLTVDKTPDVCAEVQYAGGSCLRLGPLPHRPLSGVRAQRRALTHLAGERVQLGGRAALFSVGEIFLPPDAK